jgi:hypothetical protein
VHHGVTLALSAGGFVNTATVSSGGVLIFEGGNVANANLLAGATEAVLGATVSSLSVHHGVTLVVSGGGLVSSATISSGGSAVVSGGFVDSSTVLAGGIEILKTGGTIGAVSGAGTLALQSATYDLPAAPLSVSAVSISSGATLAATGTLSATSVVNAGKVSVTSGTLSFLGAVTNSGVMQTTTGDLSLTSSVAGTGTLGVGGTGTLSLLTGTGAGQTVAFSSGTGLLDLSQPLGFLGKIASFGAGDAIDLLKTPETSYKFTSGTLILTSGTKTEASLKFTGSYTSASFSVTSDGHGGTLIKFN